MNNTELITSLNDEQSRFHTTIDCVAREMSRIDKRFDEGIEAGDAASEESVRQMLESRWRMLAKIKNAPYFARIDFRETVNNPSHSTMPASIYLGKTSIHDENGVLYAVDWRAPISTLYYENRIGRASYHCPEGEILGELLLKRQYTIENSQLLCYDDIDITSDDELLRPYLSVSSDTRLKNIIATIQSEQNRIIRSDLGKHLIVQGVAGSGKTTVALHRIAYFVYTWQNRFKPEQYMILAPNGFFLSYIAPVLPDLGVENVPQLTFEELTLSLCSLTNTVEDPVANLTTIMESEASAAEELLRIKSYKCSLQCRADLDEFIRRFEENIIPDEPLEISAYTSLSALTIRQLYEKQSKTLPIITRLVSVKKMIDNAYRDYQGFKKHVTKMFQGRLKVSILALYREFLAANGILQRTTTLAWEDLAPLLHIRNCLYGAMDRHMKHVIIDEGQDFSPFGLSVLRDIYPHATFTIFGDLAQGIYHYRGISSWKNVNDAVFEGNADISILNKSYRSTIEIMQAAGKLLAKLPDYIPGEAVVRQGEPVKYMTALAPQEWVSMVSDAAKAYAQYKHVAILLKTPAACESLSKKLGLPHVTSKDGNLPDGTCILSTALSKGLEFDAVIIADAESYGEDDTKLLYVAMTRAMHSLTVIGLGKNMNTVGI